MNSTLPLRSSSIPITRPGWLAAASAVVAVASVSVTLAVTTGGGNDPTATPASVGKVPATLQPAAEPDPAKGYAIDTHAHPLESPQDGEAAAERFHHFR